MRTFNTHSNRFAVVFAALVVVVLALASRSAIAADFIHAAGTRLVDGADNTFAVRGINLGNWLVPEGYMFKFKTARSPSEIAGVIETLVGRDEAERFWAQFRDVYITQDDIRFIKAAGFNTVRVPLNWRTLYGCRRRSKQRSLRRAGLGAARSRRAMVPRCRLARDRRFACGARRANRRQSR